MRSWGYGLRGADFTCQLLIRRLQHVQGALYHPVLQQASITVTVVKGVATLQLLVNGVMAWLVVDESSLAFLLTSGMATLYFSCSAVMLLSEFLGAGFWVDFWYRVLRRFWGVYGPKHKIPPEGASAFRDLCF